jgi:hypothetical protein
MIYLQSYTKENIAINHSVEITWDYLSNGSG